MPSEKALMKAAEVGQSVGAIYDCTPIAEALDAFAAEAVEAEEHDRQMVYEHCSKVYYHFTDGRISKPQTLPQEVIAVATDLENERLEEELRARLEALPLSEARLLAEQPPK